MRLQSLSTMIPALLATSLVAQNPEPVDAKVNAILRSHGLEQSQVMDHLSWLCDVYGPRLTGSPNLGRAQKWAMKTLESWGVENAHTESWGPFGRGWRLDHFNLSVVGDNPWPVIAYPKAWSPGVDGRQVAEIVYVGSTNAAELKQMDLKGKIVLIQGPRDVSEPFEGPAERLDSDDLLRLADSRRAQRSGRRGTTNWRAGFQKRQQMLRIVYDKQPLAIFDRGSKGQYGTVFVTSASVPSAPNTPRNERPSVRDPEAKIIPQITLAVEHYNRMVRTLEKGVQLSAALELRSTYFDDDPMQYNVLGEIKGTDPKIGKQLVMLGGHLDSWHTGTGATDNGAGSAVMLEAMRLLTVLTKELGHGPRRTIRLALWSGEEQGLYGSRAYVTDHFGKSGGRNAPLAETKPDHDLLSGYYNLDNGTGRVRGVYLQGNEAVRPLFRAWLQPFHDLDASTITMDNTGGTDHLAFHGVGLPGFQFIQDPVAYNTQTHHSNMDNWDHVIASDLQQAATIIASFVWHTAQRDEMLPRIPKATKAVNASGRQRR